METRAKSLALSASVESCPESVCDCFSIDWKNLPPSLVAYTIDSVISSTLIVPALMRS